MGGKKDDRSSAAVLDRGSYFFYTLPVLGSAIVAWLILSIMNEELLRSLVAILSPLVWLAGG